METDFITQVFTQSLYLIALMNPVSKISILTVFTLEEEYSEVVKVTIRSTLVAFGILLTVMVAGDFLLRSVFQVELYSLRLAGGLILLWVGFNALTKGVFFEVTTQSRFSELSMVPMACPMIAGPATIAASMSMVGDAGKTVSILAMIIALFVNLLFMVSSKVIGSVLKRYNIMGALIRITGLIVATIGVHMMLTGITQWINFSAL
jgi:multiple antibiotic resistance protein